MSSTSPTSPPRLTSAQRAELILKLRLSGLSFAQIGQEVGCTKQRAHKVVSDWVVAAAAEAAALGDKVRTMELARLDHLQAGLWPKAEAGDARSVDTVLRLMERRHKLLGIEAPMKIAPTLPNGEPLHDRPDRRELGEIVEALNARTALPAPKPH